MHSDSCFGMNLIWLICTFIDIFSVHSSFVDRRCYLYVDVYAQYHDCVKVCGVIFVIDLTDT